MSKKTYLGDSVYADFDGFQIVLTTENGYGPSNRICMESEVFRALFAYIEKCYCVTITTTRVEGREK